MKRVLLILLILFLPLVSAVNINLKNSFQPGETLLATIEGNFLSQITQDNVYFISDRVSLPILFDISRINDKYYLYAMLPLQEREYSLVLKNIHYYEAGQEHTKDFEKNFTVSGNITDFSVYPGFIITRGNFTIILESKTSSLDISANILNQSKTVHLPIGETKKLSFSLVTQNFTLTTLSVFAQETKYDIPVAIISNSTKIYSQSNTTNQTASNNTVTTSEEFSFAKSSYSISVNQETQKIYELYLKNTGEEIKNIDLVISDSLKDIISISPATLELESASSEKIELTILAAEEKVYRGTITANSENLSTSADITINSLSGSVIQNTTTTQEVCDSYGGQICSSNQQCKGTTIDSLNGECCIGTCEAKKSNTAWIIGILILLLVAGGLGFLYLRQKKMKQTSPKQVLEKKSADFEKRLGVESRGSLSRS